MQHAANAQSLMADFASATGVSDTSPEPRRYLWTDAFAVCNFLELYRQTGDDDCLRSARELVDQVHIVLGRYSRNDPRSGWISGLDDNEGYQHPTLGGLRIGKSLAERKAGEPFAEQLEWERDGQYFHYLTKWMQALARIAMISGDGRYHRWAMELARAAHAGFTYRAAGSTARMYWKMSVDLSRPLVTSMGHHDPLEALITYIELEAIRASDAGSNGDLELQTEIADCQAMCFGKSWATDDPLGTGGLLVDVFRLAQLQARDKHCADMQLAPLLADCEAGLEAFENSGMLDYPAEYRLAFRELGLSIGLHALARLRRLIARDPGSYALDEGCRAQMSRLGEFEYLSGQIEQFWLQAANRQLVNWQDHRDINTVMLATSLAPDGYLLIYPDTGT